MYRICDGDLHSLEQWMQWKYLVSEQRSLNSIVRVWMLLKGYRTINSWTVVFKYVNRGSVKLKAINVICANLLHDTEIKTQSLNFVLYNIMSLG